MLEALARNIYLSKLAALEKEIGCKLAFHKIPNRYINGWVSWNMTNTWKKFGLDIEKGANYFTMGKVVDDTSLRFDPNASEYQSWLGGYTVKLRSQKSWSIEDHFKLAIADQNNWLRLYGDPNPLTTIEGWKFTEISKIQVNQHSGTLYEGGCTTHSDVGGGYNTMKLRLACRGMNALFNLSNSSLGLKGLLLQPKKSGTSYELVKLQGYIVVVDLEKNVKVVLYGNGTTDTFATLKNDLLEAMKSCEIIET